MKLYLVETEGFEYDTLQSAVVYANSPEDAVAQVRNLAELPERDDPHVDLPPGELTATEIEKARGVVHIHMHFG